MASRAGLPIGVAEQLPDDLHVLSYTVGDLDLDGRLDVAVILHEPGDADFGPIPDVVPPRPILLYLAQPAGGFALEARAEHVALCGRCGGVFGDPFVDLTIEDGRISIVHYGGSAWRWTYTPTFAYDIVEDDWLLSGVSQSSFHATDPDNTFEDLSTTDVEPTRFADYVSPW